jgi:hypothetical protein
VAATNGYTSLYSGQNIPLSIGQKPFYPSPIGGTYRYGLIKETPCSLRLVATKMALAALNSHNFAAAGDMEAALGSLMSFDFRHFKTLLPLLPRLF